MIAYKCVQEGPVWQVLRQDRFVAYIATRRSAVEAAAGYAQHVIRHGGQACVQISNREVRSTLPRYAASSPMPPAASTATPPSSANKPNPRAVINLQRTESFSTL